MDNCVSLVTAIGSTLVAIATIIASSYNGKKQREHDCKMREQERDHNLKMREQEINAEKELKKQELYIKNELEVYKDFVDKCANLQRDSTLPLNEEGFSIYPDYADNEKVSAFLSSMSQLRLIPAINIDDECAKLQTSLENNKYITNIYTDEEFQSIIEKIKQRQNDIQNS